MSGSCDAAVQTEDWLSWVVGVKKRGKIIIDDRCVMCESDAGYDVEHLLLTCGEFGGIGGYLLDEVSRIVRTGEWLE